VSGSHDGTARITLVPDLDPQKASEPLHSAASLRLHTSPISSVAANEAGSLVLTAGWDGLLGLFSTAIPRDDEVVDVDEDEVVVSRKKRRRVDPASPRPTRKVGLTHGFIHAGFF
jgi:ribosome biogenesis protein YTM1